MFYNGGKGNKDQNTKEVNDNLITQSSTPISQDNSFDIPSNENINNGGEQNIQNQQLPPLRIKRARRNKNLKGPSSFDRYIQGMAAKHKGLEQSLKEQGINESVVSFIKRMVIASVLVGVVIGSVTVIVFLKIGLNIFLSSALGLMLGAAGFEFSFSQFLMYPSKKKKSNGKDVEKNILFAARDLIISLRSGMPLFNALVSVSTGYGATSREFAKIVERVQLGTSLENAIDETVSETKSESFRKLMLQASVSIKAGANVVESMQEIVDDLSRERVIQLRAYGQKLNAIAMFYMLFGVILPSMGIAVVTILTTFIALIVVTPELLYGVLVGIIFLQIVFLQMIRSSRPVFTM